jgi:hypothetical protein
MTSFYFLSDPSFLLKEVVMGYLTVISETGFPHSVCRFEYYRKTEWCGFKPTVPKAPVFKGYVDRSDRTRYIEHLVKFEINDFILERVIKEILKKYEGLTYCVGTGPDCVNLSVDAAKWSGLKTPPPPNMIPGNLVFNLAQLNSSLVVEHY